MGSAFPLIVVGNIIVITILFKGKTFYQKDFWKYAIAIGIPLVPHVVSQSLLSQFDRVMINKLVGASEAGVYSYIYAGFVTHFKGSFKGSLGSGTMGVTTDFSLRDHYTM